MSTRKEVLYEMFEEIKESLQRLETIESRLAILEKRFEDEFNLEDEQSFKIQIIKKIVGMDYSYKEFKKAQSEIMNSLNEIKSTQNTKWWERIFQ